MTYDRPTLLSTRRCVALCVLALCAGAGRTASADVDVFFTTMEINDCKEFGTCNWKLSCALGTSQVQTVFFSMVEGDTGDNIQINSTLTAGQFPVVVNCTVNEHDGGIGAGWEDVEPSRSPCRAPARTCCTSTTTKARLTCCSWRRP